MVLPRSGAGATAKIFMAYHGYVVFVPPKNIASVLNNESNLRILEKLKVRPYYPRELAAEMGLSEPFVVRRLKAMEEHDIVEGRWEAEGTRKVKRYHAKDVRLQLGKDGLKVTTAEIPVKTGINLKNEMYGRLLRLPLLAIFAYGILFNVPILIGIMLVLIFWYLLINIAYYLEYRFTTSMLSTAIYALGTLVLAGMLFADYLSVAVPAEAVAVVTALFAVALVLVLVYQSRYYQLEYEGMFSCSRELVSGLGGAPVLKKIFYLPVVIKWKINEYFGLV
jgi:DNA-binding transcriptional ArsR family regulator